MFKGQRLLELRRMFGVSQQALANAINVSKVAICSYEKGNRIPSLKNLIDLADYFEVTTDYLLGRDSLKDKKKNNNVFK